MPGDESQSQPPPPLHSVFISYSSVDRAAARALCDTLAAAGLEVWLDEDELAGGEAWDTKLRNQIRTCTYFMPVISASTEVRREGYFRREWRLAVERTLDFADDVLFLVPVVIDGTRDAGARVPEKFFTVQWLRVPGGRETPELRELAQRLARGDAVAAPPAPIAPPSAEKPGKAARKGAEPPPFPKFPAYPEHGNKGRFAYELVTWFGHLLLAFWGHLPRWVRVIAAIVIIFNVIGLFKSRDSNVSFGSGGTKPKAGPAEIADPADAVKRAKDASDIAAEVNKALWNVGNPNRTKRAKDKVAGTLQSMVGTAAEALQTGRPVALVTFSGEGEKNGDYAEEVFGEVCTQLQKDGKPQWGLSPLPLKPDALDAEVVSRGVRMKSRFVLTGHAGVLLPGTAPAFVVRLFDVAANQLVWKETFETAKNEPEAVAQRITVEVIKRLEPAAAPAPATPPPPAPKPPGT